MPHIWRFSQPLKAGVVRIGCARRGGLTAGLWMPDAQLEPGFKRRGMACIWGYMNVENHRGGSIAILGAQEGNNRVILEGELGIRAHPLDPILRPF